MDFKVFYIMAKYSALATPPSLCNLSWARSNTRLLLHFQSRLFSLYQGWLTVTKLKGSTSSLQGLLGALAGLCVFKKSGLLFGWKICFQGICWGAPWGRGTCLPFRCQSTGLCSYGQYFLNLSKHLWPRNLIGFETGWKKCWSGAGKCIWWGEGEVCRLWCHKVCHICRMFFVYCLFVWCVTSEVC